MVYRRHDDCTVVPKHVEMKIDCIAVRVVTVVGLTEENKLIKIHGVSSFKTLNCRNLGYL